MSNVKKKVRKKKYLPIYAGGGPFGQAAGYGNTVPDMNSGISNINSSGQTNGLYNNIGSISSTANMYNAATAEEPWEKGYSAGMATVSKAGPIGAIIGGVTAVGDAAFKPMQEKANKVDASTGEFENFDSARKAMQFQSTFNPFKAGMRSMSDPNATTFDKALSWTGLGGLTAQKRLSAQENEQMELAEEVRNKKLATTRLQEESNKPMMQFKSGGKLYPNGGKLTPAQTVSKNYRPQSYQTQQYGDFNKADYGDLLTSTPMYSPAKPDSLVSVENYYKGVPGPQYFKPGTPGSRMEKYTVDGKTRLAGSETPIKAKGGYLEETRNNPDVTYFANGGTHSENSNGGIPLGNKGKVEEGEVRYKDYIFSNRF